VFDGKPRTRFRATLRGASKVVRVSIRASSGDRSKTFSAKVRG
jgi:hypothetical protein